MFSLDYSTLQPGVRFEEKNDAFIYEVETPGVSKENVRVWLSEDRRKIYVDAVERDRRYREVLTIPPPYEAEPDKVEAEYRDGLLVIKIKKVRKGFEIKIK